MIPYITFREKDEDGNLCYFILQKAFPHFLGKIVTRPIEGALANEPIPGHNLWVTFNSTLRGNMIPNYKNIQEEIAISYHSMACWFHAERIVMDGDRFKKFKIKTNDSSTTG